MTTKTYTSNVKPTATETSIVTTNSGTTTDTAMTSVDTLASSDDFGSVAFVG